MTSATPASDVVKGATIIAQVADPSSSSIGPGTAYSIQMTECQTCTKNTQTINTMLAVMQQQATTVKDQQGTIASLITMLSNATGGNGAKVQQVKRVYTGSHLTASGKRSHHRKPDPGSILQSGKRVGDGLKGVPLTKKARQEIAASSAPKPRKVTNGEGQGLPASDLEDLLLQLPVSENGLPAQEFIVKHQGGGSEADDELVTKIWIRGTPHEKCPCPLVECEGRKFAAADMYYLRRHFQQVHRLSHPNPLFVIQCPVDDCGAEFESSLRDMRKHLNKDHPDAYPPRTPTKLDFTHMEGEMGDEDVEEGGEEADAAAELEEEPE